MKVFLIPPPALPVPAVKGGAVETLLEHLIFENERLGLLELVCVSVPDDAARAKAAGLKHTRMHWVEAQPDRRKYYRFLCGMLRRLGKAAPIDPWYNQVKKLVDAEQPDFVICEGGDPTELCAISESLGRERCLLHLHGPTSGSPELDRLYGGIISLSDFVLRDFLATSTIPAEKCRLLPNCIDLDRFHPVASDESKALRRKLGFEPGDFVVLFCGRIAEEKGIHKLVEAFTRLDDPHIRLLVVGSPFFAAQDSSPFMEQLKADAVSLGNRIIFTGFIPNEQLPAYYSAADLACFPALWQEPAGLVAIEAMACGCPVLATRSGGMAEYLAGSGALELSQEGDLPGALADAIRQLRDDSAARQEMCRNGRECSRKFGREGYCRRFAEILTLTQKEM